MTSGNRVPLTEAVSAIKQTIKRLRQAATFHNEFVLLDSEECVHFAGTLESILATIEALTTQVAMLTAERDFLEPRVQHKDDILEWLEEKIGTSWECECGVSTYNSSHFECQECSKQAPDLHVLAFKLHAELSDPRGEEPTSKVELDNNSSYDFILARADKAESALATVTAERDAALRDLRTGIFSTSMNNLIERATSAEQALAGVRERMTEEAIMRLIGRHSSQGLGFCRRIARAILALMEGK